MFVRWTYLFNAHKHELFVFVHIFKKQKVAAIIHCGHCDQQRDPWKANQLFHTICVKVVWCMGNLVRITVNICIILKEFVIIFSDDIYFTNRTKPLSQNNKDLHVSLKMTFGGKNQDVTFYWC